LVAKPEKPLKETTMTDDMMNLRALRGAPEKPSFGAVFGLWPLTLAAQLVPDFPRNRFSPARLLQRLLTSLGRYEILISWKFNKLRDGKLLTFSQSRAGAKRV
jgi:hypothetical protein